MVASRSCHRSRLGKHRFRSPKATSRTTDASIWRSPTSTPATSPSCPTRAGEISSRCALALRAARGVALATSIVAGKFGTGNVDLAVTDSENSVVDILQGHGDGTFSVTSSLAVGSNPFSMVAGDFGNGTLDLAVANANTNNVSVLLGNGNGTFQLAVGFAAGTAPTDIVAGDFNGDGRLDLATGNYYPTTCPCFSARAMAHSRNRTTTRPATRPLPPRQVTSPATATSAWPSSIRVLRASQSCRAMATAHFNNP